VECGGMTQPETAGSRIAFEKFVAGPRGERATGRNRGEEKNEKKSTHHPDPRGGKHTRPDV